jgi:hypothetical protein
MRSCSRKHSNRGTLGQFTYRPGDANLSIRSPYAFGRTALDSPVHRASLRQSPQAAKARTNADETTKVVKTGGG